MSLPAQLFGALVSLACIGTVVVRAATAPAPPPLRPATPAEEARFAAAAAGSEAEWRRKAARDFPADNWSQRDAFHGHEATFVRELAEGAGVPYEDVLHAIDVDVHRTAARRGSRPDRAADAVPLKPRPIFD